MKLKRTSELAYILAIPILALGTVFCAKAKLGMSMIAALSYCLKPFFGGFQGLAEYLIQAVLLVIFCLVMQRVRWQYLLSFVTAVLFGTSLFLFEKLFWWFDPQSYLVRIPLFIAGTLIVAFAVALFLKSYLPAEVYELFVKGLNEKFGLSVRAAKWIVDGSLLFLAALLALIIHFIVGKGWQDGFPGLLSSFEKGGVWIGTVVSTIVTGPLVALFGKLLDKISTFEPRFPRLYNLLADKKDGEEKKKERDHGNMD